MSFWSGLRLLSRGYLRISTTSKATCSSSSSHGSKSSTRPMISNIQLTALKNCIETLCWFRATLRIFRGRHWRRGSAMMRWGSRFRWRSRWIYLISASRPSVATTSFSNSRKRYLSSRYLASSLPCVSTMSPCASGKTGSIIINGTGR